MYARYGMIGRSHHILEEPPIQDVVSRNECILGYMHHGQDREALKCFERMQITSLTPNPTIFICVLKACGIVGAIDKGKEIHCEIVSRGLLEKDVMIGTALVDMYCKCSALSKAQDVLKRLSIRNIVSWNALITGYAHKEKGQEALDFYEQMKSEGFSPDSVTFTCILKACGRIGCIENGKKMHHEIISTGLLEEDFMLGTPLADMYVKCGMFRDAQHVVDQVSIKTVTCWNALIAGYAQNDQGQEAITCFGRMRSEGFSPDVVTFTCILKACGGIGSIDIGKQIHDEIMSRGLLQNNIMLGNALVDMYAKCGVLDKAKTVLEGLPVKNVVSWNALIAGYIQQGQGNEALNCFELMKSEVSPDAVTFISILKACGKVRDIDKGEQIHEDILSRGLLGKDIVLGCALVGMYTKCGVLAKAQQLLEEFPIRNIVSWSALISGYVLHGHDKEALTCYGRMKSCGLSPNSVTFISLLKACAKTMAITIGVQIHSEITQKGFVRSNIVLGTTLIDMYVKCGELCKAQQVLYKLPYRDTVSWNTIIAGFAEQGQYEEALDCFDKMQGEGISPDAKTFGCILKACGIIGSIEKGDEIHDEIFEKGFVPKDIVLGTALVDMYAKCGTLAKAEEVFKKLPFRDIVSWNTLIAGYAQHGQGEEALNCLSSMQREGVSPNTVTFRCILNACSRSGLVIEGEICFVDMSRQYGIMQDIEHHTCMIDLFGRVGNFEKVSTVLRKFPRCDYLLVWDAILGACQKWVNVELGRIAFERAIQLDSHNSSSYILMANIYVTAGMHQDATEIEVMKAKYFGEEVESLNNAYLSGM